MRLRVQSAAKINLVLNVLGQRADGFHELRTVLQSVSLYDTLDFARADGLEVDAPQGITQDVKQNLVYRAAEIFGQKYAPAKGVKITLTKNIPLAAGLAGGSTDCAGTLLGLNKFFALGLPNSELAKIANQLGSDIAYCLHGGTCLAEGRGELLKKLPELPKMHGLILQPPFACPTGAVYGKVSPAKNKPLELGAYRGGKVTVENLQANLRNDLIEPALLWQPRLTEYFKAVEDTGPAAWQMSGSGASIFAFYKDSASRDAAILALPGHEIYPIETTDSAQNITEI
ncbi:4-diphosphocytidyl-2C-methyl-D-erythritol kinase [Candidatus Termititenax persephonae]|uniref:4-diphosphocytidyl-2-C-methyl-D-erythritol kinase n=1 Tax=Candidatus Termititenax persephonae TaxID=2218525 RepID=A0A388TIA1_9BACT|nr:4-diphosphocytidyl-2C-methyl-D-erythritol kinase [Candidatus Termititenax persephonae]